MSLEIVSHVFANESEKKTPTVQTGLVKMMHSVYSRALQTVAHTGKMYANEIKKRVRASPDWGCTCMQLRRFQQLTLFP